MLPSLAIAQTITVNLTDYVAQTANAQMLCQSDGQLCLEGFYNPYGEFTYVYSNGIVDYIGRSYDPQSAYGVIRNIPGPADQTRCFANVGSPCTAPSNAANFPEAVPQVIQVKMVSLQTELDSENADGTPRIPISGFVSFTNAQFTLFGINAMDSSTCRQTYLGQVGNLVLATYVQNVSFGGNLGTHDALVIDELEQAYPGGQRDASRDHIERYFYVQGYGRVREASSTYDVESGQYDLPLSRNSVRNMIQPSRIGLPGTVCPQGTATLN